MIGALIVNTAFDVSIALGKAVFVILTNACVVVGTIGTNQL